MVGNTFPCYLQTDKIRFGGRMQVRLQSVGVVTKPFAFVNLCHFIFFFKKNKLVD